MPKINDIKNAREIGRSGRSNWIWVPCSECSKERWMILSDYNKKKYTLCQSCAMTGQRNKSWKEGRTKTKEGYIAVLLYSESPYFKMANIGRKKRLKNWYVFEHRLVMAKHLGRCLTSLEIVHHKNGIADDNRLSNLYLTTRETHIKEHQRGYRDGFNKGYQDGLKKATEESKVEIILSPMRQKEVSHSTR